MHCKNLNTSKNPPTWAKCGLSFAVNTSEYDTMNFCLLSINNPPPPPLLYKKVALSKNWMQLPILQNNGTMFRPDKACNSKRSVTLRGAWRNKFSTCTCIRETHHHEINQSTHFNRDYSLLGTFLWATKESRLTVYRSVLQCHQFLKTFARLECCQHHISLQSAFWTILN